MVTASATRRNTKGRARGERAPSIVPDQKETKRDKFLRLGTPRVQRVLNSIRLVGNLASPNYQWNSEDLAAMRAVMQEQLDKTMARFEKAERGVKPVFEFQK